MPLATLSAVGTGVALAGDLGKTIYGAIQGIGGNKRLNELNASRPQRSTDPLYLQNQQLAAQGAEQGLSNQERNAFDTEIGQNTASGINAVEKTGGSPNLISKLVNQNNDPFLKELALDAQTKRGNMENLYKANDAVANQNNINWDYNINIPFQQKYNQAVNQTNSGAINAFGGTQQAGSALAAGSTSYNKILGDIASRNGLPKMNGGGADTTEPTDIPDTF